MNKNLLTIAFLFGIGFNSLFAQKGAESKTILKLNNRPIKSALISAKRPISGSNASRSTTCGQDTIKYPLYKEFLLGPGNTDSLAIDYLVASANRTASTAYLNPGTISVKGISFWGLGFHNVNRTISTKVILYSVDVTNKPTTELASANLTVGNLAASGAVGYEYTALFSSPVNVTGNYAVAVKYNNFVTGDSLCIFVNDAGDPDYPVTYGEGLTWRRYGSGTWNPMLTYWGQDAEYLIYPIVDYSIDATLNLPSSVCSVPGSFDANYNGTASEILNSRFYNLNKFFNYWVGLEDSTYIIDIDGSLTVNDTASGTLSTAGNYDVTLTTSLLNYGLNVCTDNQTKSITVNQASSWYADTDNDGFGDPSVSQDACSRPTGYVSNSLDCDDSDANIKAPTRYYADNDLDGFGDVGNFAEDCALTPPSGYVTDSTDCNDSDPLNVPTLVWYIDRDGDGFGNVDTFLLACEAPTGYVDDSTDCNDIDANVNPSLVWYRDADGDGFGNPNTTITSCLQPAGYVSNNSDCNDNNSNTTVNNFYADADGDGFGDVNGTAIQGCNAPNGYVSNNSDCDDSNDEINPNTVWYIDADNDGFGDVAVSDTGCTSTLTNATLNNTDCDDNDNNIWQTGTFYIDADGDGVGSTTTGSVCYGLSTPTGYSVDSTDCDDSNDQIYQSSTLFIDADNDGFGSIATAVVCRGLNIPAGYSNISGDCDDANPNSTGVIWYADLDEDGYGNNTDSVIACLPPVGYIASIASLGNDCDDNDSTSFQSSLLFVDADGDGYALGSASLICYGDSIPAGYASTSSGTDCDDSNANTYQSSSLFVDADGDGYTVGSASTICYGASVPTGYSLTSSGPDCDDSDTTLFQSSSLFVDADGDGYTVGSASTICYGASVPTGYSLTSSGPDCDDSDTTLFQSSSLFVDTDGDGYTVGSASTICYGANIPTGYVSSSNGEDCDDNNAAVNAASVDAAFGINNSQDPTVVFTATTTGQTTYSWYINDVLSGNDTTLSNTFTQDGSYTIKLVVEGTCGAVDSTTQTVNIINTSLVNNSNVSAVIVSPNPASSFVNVTAVGVKNAQILMTNLNGQIISETKVDFSVLSVASINTSEIAEGVYFVKVISNNATSVTRLVINR